MKPTTGFEKSADDAQTTDKVEACLNSRVSEFLESSYTVTIINVFIIEMRVVSSYFFVGLVLLAVNCCSLRLPFGFSAKKFSETQRYTSIIEPTKVFTVTEAPGAKLNYDQVNIFYDFIQLDLNSSLL